MTFQPPNDSRAPLDDSGGRAGPLVVEYDPTARTWGMVGHLLALAFFAIPACGHLVGPLVVWLLKKDSVPFAGDQAKEALNFNLTWTIVGFAFSWTFCIGIGFVILPAIYVFMLVMTIVAAVRANHGEAYRYPLTLRLVT